jgi:Transposase DDE domain group 1
VVAKVEFHFGELFPRVGFIVTNLETDSRAVVRFYHKRGTAEQWIKEGKGCPLGPVKMTRLSWGALWAGFRSNEVRLQLSVMAYKLRNLWRRLVLPKKIESWWLTSLQQRLVKTGGRLMKRGALLGPVLLADAGGEPSDAAAVWQHGAAHGGASGTGGLERVAAGRSNS